MMTARENGFEARLRCLESEVEGEKALTRHIFKKASGNCDEIAAIRVEITTLQLQAKRAADNIEFIKTTQVQQGTMLNILTQIDQVLEIIDGVTETVGDGRRRRRSLDRLRDQSLCQRLDPAQLALQSTSIEPPPHALDHDMCQRVSLVSIDNRLGEGLLHGIMTVSGDAVVKQSYRPLALA